MYMPGALCRLALMFFVLNLAAGGVKVGYCDADLELRNRSFEVLSHN